MATNERDDGNSSFSSGGTCERDSECVTEALESSEMISEGGDVLSEGTMERTHDHMAPMPAFWGLDLSANLRESMLDMRLKKRWWRQPKLHWDSTLSVAKHETNYLSDIHSHLESHRGETWYELFHDLIFVAAALQIGHIVQSEISFDGLFKSGVLFAVMRATWDQLMFYQNRFDTKDMVHYLFYLLQSMCAFIMACHLTLNDSGNAWDKDSNLVPFTVAVVVSRLSNAVIYSQVASHSINFHKHFLSVVLSQILAAAIYVLPISFRGTDRFYFVCWLCAIFVERSFVALYIFCFTGDAHDKSAHRAPWHLGHLRHREGTFILLILGEAIIQLVLQNDGHSLQIYVRGLLGFATVFNIGDLYYQQQLLEKSIATSGGQQVYPTYLSILSLHLFLSMSILFFASGIKLVYDNGEDGESDKHREEALLLCSTAAVSIVIIFLLRIQHKGLYFAGGTRYRHLSYLFRFFIALLCAAIPFVTYSPTWCISALFLLTTLLQVQEMLSVNSHVKDDASSSSRYSSRDNDPSYILVRNEGGGLARPLMVNSDGESTYSSDDMKNFNTGVPHIV